MNTIDLIVCLVLALAVWNGWRKGFIVQVCSLVAIAVGLWCAAHYGPGAGEALHLDPSVRTAGGFAVVLLAAMLVIALAARLLRRVFRFVGFGMLDIALGIGVSVLKYMLVVSALFAAFDRLNADYSLVDSRIVEHSRCYRPVLRLSEWIFPVVEWVGEQVPDDASSNA
ncbi:MAG: CvpA family protein [Alistipes sp.]|nr:CvpA family protein [Alistipes sp.]